MSIVGFGWIKARWNRDSWGFTLIELLVVVACIGILSGLLFVVINPSEQVKKSRDAQRKHDLSQVQKALEVYYNDKGRYPNAVIAGEATAIEGAPWGEPWPGYMEVMPKDPLGSKEYVYQVDASGNTYRLYAKLDRCSDNEVITVEGFDCATEVYNYSVTSPNLLIARFALVSPPPPPTATSTPSPTATLAPTPTIAFPAPIAYWRMDEASGTMVGDSSANGINGTSSSTSNISTSGKFGNARTFNGTSDHISIPNNSKLNFTNGLTFAAWLLIASDFSDWGGVFSRGSYNKGWDILISPGAADFRSSCLTSGTDNFIATGLTSGSGWHHFVVTFDSVVQSIKTYRDGVLISSNVTRGDGSPKTPTGVLCSTSETNYIGKEVAPDTAQRKFKGSIDDVRIYNRALTPSEVGVLATLTPTPTLTLTPTVTPTIPTATPIPCSSGLLVNGCFESQQASWDCHGAISGNCNTDSSTKFGGAYSVKVTNTGGWWGWQLSQGGITASLGEQFCLSARVKKQTSTDAVSIAIQETGPGTNWLQAGPFATDTTDWQLVRNTVTVGTNWHPPIQVYLRAWQANQAAWFDDVSLTRGACL